MGCACRTFKCLEDILHDALIIEADIVFYGIGFSFMYQLRTTIMFHTNIPPILLIILFCVFLISMRVFDRGRSQMVHQLNPMASPIHKIVLEDGVEGVVEFGVVHLPEIFIGELILVSADAP